MFHTWLRKLTAAAMAISAMAYAGSMARASEYDDGMSVKYYDAFKGNKVVLIVISSGMDIAQGLAAGLTPQGQDLGYEISVRDYNWNNDQGAQSISQAISEKPDVLVVQNLDLQAYASLFKRATKEGIKAIQVQVKSTTNTDAYVGVDWYQVAYKNISKLVNVCSPRAGKSGKIAILQGTPNNPTNFVGMKAVADVLKDHPDIKVVSEAASLMIVAEGDDLTLWDLEIRAFNQIPTTKKRLEVLPHTSHMTLYSDKSRVEIAAAMATGWFVETLKPRAPGIAER
jgi:ribose transport system substrate-binding protein